MSMSAPLAPLPTVGQTAKRTRTITEADLRAFAELSDDHNPVHLDEAYAASTPFGRRIVYGMLTASLISALLASELPGPGTIYLGQTLSFRQPVFLGDAVTVTLTVSAVRPDKRIVTLTTTCTNQADTVVLTGEATVKC